jgi:hypothetical protein
LTLLAFELLEEEAFSFVIVILKFEVSAMLEWRGVERLRLRNAQGESRNGCDIMD